MEQAAKSRKKPVAKHSHSHSICITQHNTPHVHLTKKQSQPWHTKVLAARHKTKRKNLTWIWLTLNTPYYYRSPSPSSPSSPTTNPSRIFNPIHPLHPYTPLHTSSSPFINPVSRYTPSILLYRSPFILYDPIPTPSYSIPRALEVKK